MSQKLVDLTPAEFRCDVGTTCPGIFKSGDKYLIIGKSVRFENYPEVAARVGEGEILIEVSDRLLANVAK